MPRPRPMLRVCHAALATALLAGLVPIGGCKRPSDGKAGKPVLLYCSVDEVFARTLIDAYEARTGATIRVIFDSEAGKTTGLVNRIVSEARSGRTRADVFWSSELFNTILLARKGLLASYDPPPAVDIPARFKDAQHRWTALAVRARVLAFDPRRVDRRDLPTTWAALSDGRFARELALANPLFGTTRGHVAAMFALWGEERGRTFLSDLYEGGVHLVDGNSSAVRAVIAGRVRLAVTDSDDVWVAQARGAALDCVYPDMGDGGTLLIPCSVALLAGGPNGAGGRRLVDFLVSAEVERMLAESDSRNIPVRSALRDSLRLTWPAESGIGFEAVADAMEEAVAATRDILIR